MTNQMIENTNALDQYLELLGEEGPEFIIEIIDSFLEGAPGYLDELDQSLAQNDFATFHRAAHSLKTGCATVGASGLAKQFLVLEEAGAYRNLSLAGQALQICKPAFRKLTDELIQKKGVLS